MGRCTPVIRTTADARCFCSSTRYGVRSRGVVSTGVEVTSDYFFSIFPRGVLVNGTGRVLSRPLSYLVSSRATTGVNNGIMNGRFALSGCPKAAFAVCNIFRTFP